MNTYTVSYYFSGYGEAKIDAKSEKEARDKFFDGDYDFTSEQEWGEDYEVEKVEKVVKGAE